MPAHMMVLNPIRRRKSKGKKRRAKMTAKQLQYFGPKAKRRKARRAAKPKVVVVSTNPRGHKVAKRKSRKKHRRHYRKNPISFRRKARRSFRRNPLPAGFFKDTIGPAAIGAGGALLVDLLFGNIALPANFRTGLMGPIAKMAAALGIGALVDMVGGQKAGESAAAGAITVTLYALARNYMAVSMPNVRLGRYVPMNGMGVMRRAGRGGMARYVPMRGMGAGGQQQMMFRRRMASLKGMGTMPAAIRPVRMGAFVNPARTVGMVPGGGRAMARFMASNAA